MKQFFSGSLPFSGVALLNWFTKNPKFAEGFNNNELSWSLSRSFNCVMLLSVVVQQARKFLLLDKELKGKIVLQHLCNTRIYYSSEDTCNLNKGCYISYESKVHRGHTEQLYLCLGHFLHKSCKEIWDD